MKFLLFVSCLLVAVQVAGETRDMTTSEIKMICEKLPDKCPKKDAKSRSFQVIGGTEMQEMSLMDPEVYETKEYLVLGYSVPADTRPESVVAMASFPSKTSRDMLFTECYLGQIRKVCFSKLYLSKSRKFREPPSKIEVTILNRNMSFKADWSFSAKAREILKPYIEQ